MLDNCFGSGNSGVAAVKTNRSYIGIEMDEAYYLDGRFQIIKEKRNGQSACASSVGQAGES